MVVPSKVLQKQAPAQSDEGFCLWPSSTIPILTARRDPDGTRTEPIHGRGAIEEPSLSLAIPRLLHSFRHCQARGRPCPAKNPPSFLQVPLY